MTRLSNVQILNIIFNSKLDRYLKIIVTGQDILNPDEDFVVSQTLGHFITREWKEWAIYSDVFSIIDGKSSALLTHISIMIALNVTVINSQYGVVFILFAINLFSYVIAAYACLRCLRFWSFNDSDLTSPAGDTNKAAALIGLRIEMFFRQELYKLALNVASVATLFSVVLFIWIYAFQPTPELAGSLVSK